MSEWLRFVDTTSQHTITGDVRVYHNLHSPQLKNERDIYVWLPAAYEGGEEHYPVLYMHDGQNLFDEHISYSGEWQADETMQQLETEGYAAIIVAIRNDGDNRTYEYNPYGDKGDAYLRFVLETVKPLIDASFRTQPDVNGIAGSSMGGLISLYGFLQHQDVFSFCGALSTAFWYGNNALLQTISQQATGQGKIYLDVGGCEGYILRNPPAHRGMNEPEDPDLFYLEGVRQLRDALLKAGYTDKNLLYVEEEVGKHHESDWARRLPHALRFLLEV